MIKQFHIMPIVEDEYMPHTDVEECFCEPELVYVDSGNGNQVWLHRELH